MSRWNRIQLGDVFFVGKGKVGIQAAIQGDYDLVTTGEKFGTHIEYHFEGEAICIPMISSTGHGHASLKRIHYVNGKFAAGNILAACINKNPEKTLGRFVFYYLSTKKDNLIVPLMQGSANVSLKLDDISKIELLLPSIEEQRAIVARLDAVAEKVRQVETKLDEIEEDAERLLAIRFREAIDGATWRTMGEVAPLIRRDVQIELEGHYPELGIRSFGKGTFHKPPLDGAEVGTKRLFRIEVGDLLFSNVFAWEGAIAVAQPNDSGRFGSHRFISCVANPDAASPEFLRYYFLTPQGLEQIGEASPGGAGRNRTLGIEKLMALKVPVPKLAKQQAFDTLQTKVAELKAKHTETRLSLNALLPSLLEQIFKNA